MAEQAFLAWYFRYAGMRLSSLYNTNFQIWYHHTGRLGAGGGKPLALHFSDSKLFTVCPTDAEWKYLCYRPKLMRQARKGKAALHHPIPGIRCSGNGTLKGPQQRISGRLDIRSFQLHPPALPA